MGPRGGSVTPSRRNSLMSLSSSAARLGANLLPYGNLAVGAYDTVNSLRNAFSKANTYGASVNYNTPSKSKTTTKRKSGGTSTGRYVGMFKKTKRNKMTVETKCLKKGYHLTDETYGRIEDPDCVYLGHSTYNQDLMVSALTGCLLRKLFKIAGISISNTTQVLSLSRAPVAPVPVDADGWRIQYGYHDPTSTSVPLSTVAYVTTATDTLQTIVQNFGAMRSSIATYFANQTDNAQPYSLTLQIPDNTDFLVSYRTVAYIDLQQQYFYIHVTSNMVIQNRSAPSDATTASEKFDSERLDNQPLQGYQYEFKNADPRVSAVVSSPLVSGNIAFNYIASSGLLLLRGGQFGLPQFQEPPVPKYFKNCTKSSKIKLQPGNIKRSIVYYCYKGTLSSLVKQLRVEKQGFWVSGVWGKCKMIALEELIRTSSTNPIKCQYERESKVGCHMKQIRQPPMTTIVTSAEQNALPE